MPLGQQHSNRSETDGESEIVINCFNKRMDIPYPIRVLMKDI